MWHEINNHDDLESFMDTMWSFHDSCIKEMRYISGAYVAEGLSMYPINDRRILSVIVQRQSEDHSVMELEFSGLKYLKLCPCDESYTCEILDSTMVWGDGKIYWCDCGGISEADLDTYDGTMICAEKLRWRAMDNCLGAKDFYSSIV